MNKSVQKITIEIEAKWGSDFQKQMGNDLLNSFCRVWAEQLNYGHKKNEVKLKIKDMI